MKELDINVGDKFFDIAHDKEFTIAEKFVEETFEWFYVESDNVTFKGKFYEKWKNSMTKQAIMNALDAGRIFKILDSEPDSQTPASSPILNKKQ